MFRLMIIDDEPIAVDSLYEVLCEALQPDFEVYRAYSSEDAFRHAQLTRMDILMCDIQMPGLNGFQLTEQLVARWPQCKVIFLTGFNDFQYVHTAIRRGSVDYVLKTEGDDAILGAVKRAQTNILNERRNEQLASKANENLNRALPILRRDFLIGLFNGDRLSMASRKRKMSELGIQLHAEEPILVTWGKIDRWKPEWTSMDRSLLLYSIENIAHEFFSPSHLFSFATIDSNSFLWLIQPIGEEENREVHYTEYSFSFIQGITETVQATCRELLGLPVSLTLTKTPCDWERLSASYNEMKWFALTQAPYPSEEAMIIYSQSDLSEQTGGPTISFREPSVWRRIELMEAHLEQHQRESFLSVLKEVMRLEHGCQPGEAAASGIYALEKFNIVSAFFLSQLSKYGLMLRLSERMSLDKLSKWDEQRTWEETENMFNQVTRFLFDELVHTHSERTNELIDAIHRYIANHLSEDLSLTKLADVVSLNASYLSRFYKQQTGKGLLESITEARILKAKELLLYSPLKIHEISAAVGFFSSTYFARVFKKSTLLSPQEFRDSVGSKM